MNNAAALVATPFVVLASSASAHAETTTTLRPIVTTAAVCDPTVSVWREPNRNRLVYILGTAHISKLSAELAGTLVREIHPDAVFVELDLKRVGGLAKESPQEEATTSAIVTTSTTYATPTSTIVVPTVAGSSSAPAPAEEARRSVGFFTGLRQKALTYASSIVGASLREMYKNLGDQGFSPGEEFAAAVSEGQKYGAAVVLGDQDVEVTLNRLTQALAVTDLSKLNDAELQAKFNEILPGGEPPAARSTGEMDQVSKDELTTFVETLKSRENVRAIMAQLREVAPALVQVMLTERDAYMATGLDTLNNFECIVAVMGIAHMDGVEQNLRQMGWKPVVLKCPVR